MNSKEIIKYLKNSIDEKGNYCYSLPIETTRKTIKCIKEKDKEIERLNNIIKEVREWVHKIQLDNKRLEPIISTDELDGILGILDKADKDV